MKTEPRMKKILQAVEQMEGRGVISSEERKINNDLVPEEKDTNNLTTFIHNAKVSEEEDRKR